MEVKIWDGGLQTQEVKAIEKIQKAFQKPKLTGSKPLIVNIKI